MTITLWGRQSSANVQKVWWALEELGLAYDHRIVGGPYGGTDTPDYRALNPTGLVPTLQDTGQDGDLALWESDAIVRYLSAQYGAGTLWPENPVQRAQVDKWMVWSSSTLFPALLGLFINLVRMPDAQKNQNVIDRALKQATAAYKFLEGQMGDRKFMAGDHLTMADLIGGVTLYRWYDMDIDRPVLPKVRAWYDRLCERDAYRKTVCTSYAELVGRLTF